MRVGKRILVGLLVVLVALGGLMFWLQRMVLYPSYAVPPLPHPGEGVVGLVRLHVDSEQGPVEGWFLPGDGVDAGRPGPAVIFAHGNGEVIDYWPQQMEGYRRLGVSVLLPEYRGYGRSAGSPSQEAITSDLLRFHDRLVARPEVDRRRLVYHGRSLGGGAVCALAGHRPPAALILSSTFTSIRDAARRYLVPGFLIRDVYDNLSVVRQLTCPVLIAHGRRDSLLPFSHALELRAAARQATLLTYPESDHNDCPPDWDQFMGEVQRFLHRAGVLGEQEGGT